MTKKASGHENRLRKRAELEQARQNETERRKESGEVFLRDTLKPPPVGNSAAAVSYAADCALVALSEVQADKQLTAEQRWNWVDKLTKTIGMTYNKNAIQERLRKLERPDEPEDDDELEPNPYISRGSTKR